MTNIIFVYRVVCDGGIHVVEVQHGPNIGVVEFNLN